MISLRQLEVFVRVAEHKSFTAAAKELFMTQPGVSAQIKTLEEKLEVQLLERNEKSALLTEAGELLYHEAKKILGIFEGFMESLDDLKGIRRGRLTLLASTIPGEYVLPGFIGAFARRHPEVEISLNITDTGVVVRSLLERKADLGFIGARVNNEDLVLEEFIRDELIVIGPPGKKYDEKTFSLADLAGEPWILREPGSGTRMVFYEKLTEAGIDPKSIRVVMELGSTRAIISAVEYGLGLGIVSRLAAADSLHMGKISEINLEGGGIFRSLYMAWNKNKYQSFATRVFMSFLRDGIEGRR